MDIEIVDLSDAEHENELPCTSKNCSNESLYSREKEIIDYDALYEQVSIIRSNKLLDAGNYEEKDVQHPLLLPKLRAYQSRAVNWMIYQETHSRIGGGILADEMGLGKTVEIIALILNHPRECLANPEFLESVTDVKDLKLDTAENTIDNSVPSSIKKSKTDVGTCSKCSKRNFCSSIENVIWRFNPDKEKSIIQEVIDRNCGTLEDEANRSKQSSVCTCGSITRQRLTSHYNNALAEYSGLKSLYAKKNAAQDEPQILCVCGDTEQKDKHLVECQLCKRMQHITCVHYDLSNPERGLYFCPQCWITLEPVQSNATVIITPSSISNQWIDEIGRHLTKHLNILVYEGVHSQGYRQPVQLARQYDVIIVSYETLRKELYFAEVKTGEKRSRRKAASYMAPPSPLLSIEFWRVCLDEAQMVEGSTTRAAEMARKLKTIHRWCVTGTPIQKSVQDLYGLLLFLGIEIPKNKILDTASLTEILAPVFWRTRKSMVTDQIYLPEQTVYTHWLSFSALEEHFYQQQEVVCAKDFSKRFSDHIRNPQSKMRLSSLDPHTLKVLLNPLLRLRQACVHPQMVRGQFLTMRAQTKTMTMEELLVSLIKRAQVECEESQRLRVAAANGLAAVYSIKEEWDLAAEKYRDILRWAEELKDSVKTDTLQKLHTMHNLADVLRSAPAGQIPPTLRDSLLEEEAEQLRKHYLEKASAQVEAARSLLTPLTAQVAALKNELDANSEALSDTWWNAVFEWATDSKLAEKMVEEVKEKLQQDRDVRMSSTFGGFKNLNGLKFLLFQRLEEIDEQRQKVGNLMRSLELTSTEKLANEAADCHLRPLEGRRKKDRCQLCLIHYDIEDYESLLFRMEDRKNDRKNQEDDWQKDDEDGPAVLESLRRGTWADSEIERVLKLVLQFARKNHGPSTALEGGSTQAKLMEAYKKEFRKIRVVWRQLNDQASAVDELSMATIRLRLRLPHEVPQPKPSSKLLEKGPNSNQQTPIFLLEKHEVEMQRAKLQADLVSASNDLKRHMGRVSYLKNLEKSGYGKAGSQNPDPCPLCTTQLGLRWSALTCGHCFCMECIGYLVDQNKGAKSLKCGICRETVPLSDISYVDARPEAEDSDDMNRIKVKGSHSTKVEAVVKKLLMIRAEDPTAKCLIFSTWVDVLLIVGRALDENGITHCSLFASKAQSQLSKFKHDPTVTALLIPVQSGANGLNLTEATHIILVEPILNPGNELQAIGRIHRIGQTKPTFVHKFLVKNTVEEKMAEMLDRHRSALSSRSAGSVKENPVTVADLKNLFQLD